MMSRHLTDERLMEVMEDAADAEARAHAESCAACASRLREARDGLALAREAEVPEPSLSRPPIRTTAWRCSRAWPWPMRTCRWWMASGARSSRWPISRTMRPAT